MITDYDKKEELCFLLFKFRGIKNNIDKEVLNTRSSEIML